MLAVALNSYAGFGGRGAKDPYADVTPLQGLALQSVKGLKAYVPSWMRGETQRYKDQYVRVSHQAKQAAIRQRRRLNEMKVGEEFTDSRGAPSAYLGGSDTLSQRQRH